MNRINIPNMKLSVFCRITVAVFTTLFFLTPMSANAEDKIVTQATLLDRIQIEDMLVRYYFDLSSGKSHDLSQYYIEDAVLDVNGIVSTGRKEIEKLYAGLGEEEAGADTGGRGHMLLTNPIISVDGNKATAWAIWTGIANDDLKRAPRFLEQGREYDELVKIDGRWFIQKRYITSDSGLTETWEKTYKPRSFR